MLSPWKLCSGSLVTITITALLVSLLGLSLVMLQQLHRISIHGDTEIRIYLNPELEHQDAIVLKEKIGEMAGLKSVHLRDRNILWQEYSEHHGTLNAALAENPLPHVLVAKVTSTTLMPNLVSQFAEIDGVNLVRSGPLWSEALHKLGNVILICSMLLLLTIIRVIQNTLAVGILRRRQTVNLFSKLSAGLWFGVLGGVLACGLIMFYIAQFKGLASAEVIIGLPNMIDFYHILAISCGSGLFAAILPLPKRID